MLAVITTNYCNFAFLHSLGRKQPLRIRISLLFERLLLVKADTQKCDF